MQAKVIGYLCTAAAPPYNVVTALIAVDGLEDI